MSNNVLDFYQLRIVVQGSPPFLVVHTNAAYCRMTGIDSHLVVGKPVSFLLSIQEGITTTIHRPDDETQAAEDFEADSCPEDHATSDLAAAEASGRARAEASEDFCREISLERLIASSGFGHIHVIHASTRRGDCGMVGRNVTVVKEASSSGARAGALRRDEESNDTSLTSSCEVGLQQPPPIACRISIAPIVSSDSAMSNGVAMEKDSETHQKAKRLKHHHGPDLDSQRKPPPGEGAPHHRKYQPLQLVTHFVIQLKPHGEETGKNGSMESLSSNSISVEAKLLGLTKEELQLQRGAIAAGIPEVAEHAGALLDADMEADVEGSTSVSSGPDAVAAIG